METTSSVDNPMPRHRLVDVKVAAIDEDWLGRTFVRRSELRAT